MPRADVDKPRPSQRRAAARAITVGIAAVIAWGVLAFGAVYPWAYWPLLGASAVVGILAYAAMPGTGPTAATIRPVLVPLTLVVVGALLQAVPLPASVRTTISPATEPFLRSTDVPYAAAAALAEAQGAPPSALPRRPLSIAPAATMTAVALLASLSVLLAGVHRYLSRFGPRGLVSAIIALGVLVSVIGIVQKAVLGDDPYSGMKIYGFWAPRYKLTTPFGPFVNRNHYAGWMLMALPLGVGYLMALAETGLARVRPRWRERLLWLSSPEGGRLQLTAAAIVTMGAALALTKSRSGIGCVAVTFAVAGFFAARARRSNTGRLVVLAALSALVIVPLLWARVDLASRFTTGGLSVEQRRSAWRDAIAVARDFPLTGTGLNTYGHATLVYHAAAGSLHFQEAHNDYLQIAAEGGCLLGLPALVAMAACVRGVRQRLAADRPDPFRYWVRFGAATSLVAIALQSAVEFSLQMPGNAALFVVICAIALHDHSPARDEDRRVAHGR